jgi:hypothetical protein
MFIEAINSRDHKDQNQATSSYILAYVKCEEAFRMTGNLIHALAEIASTGSSGGGKRPDLILEWEERCQQIADLWNRLFDKDYFMPNPSVKG